MDIKVRVPSARRCYASVDWNEKKKVWLMSFGDKEKPDTDVEVEFDDNQLRELRGLLNGLAKYDIIKPEKEKEHYGTC